MSKVTKHAWTGGRRKLAVPFAIGILALGANVAGADAWDGQSWVYDTSGRVTAAPSRGTGALEGAFDSAFRTNGTSPADGVDGRFVSSGTSNPTSVSTFPAGTFLIFR